MLKPLALAALTASLASVGALLPGTAAACSCMEPGATFFQRPLDRASGVPTNTLLWVGAGQTRGLFEGETQHPIELLDDEGVVLPGVEGRLRSARETIDVFTPDFLLEPDTTYQVRVADEIISTFTTGDGPDEFAPPVPDELDRDTWSTTADPFATTSCGPSRANHGLSIEWEFLGGAVLAVLDQDGRGDLDVELVEGFVPGLGPHGGISLSNSAVCGAATWPEARRGSETEIRYGSFDIAGNFSGWSGDETIRVGPGCSTAGGSAPTSLLAMLALVGLVAVRRR